MTIEDFNGMALFLFRFYPVLLPLIIYLAWLWLARRKARKLGTSLPHFRDGNIYWLVMSSLLIAILCFLFTAFYMEGQKGQYIPPHIENGKIVPSQVSP